MVSNDKTPEHVLTTGDVARALGLAARTASKLMDDGHLASWRIPLSRDRRTTRANLLEFARAHEIPLQEIRHDRSQHLDALGLPKPAGERSGRWPTVQKAHLKLHPFCEACGCSAKKLLNVHHILPFHECPELELVETNLVTLCESPAHNCHLALGHLLNWRSWNVHVVKHARWFRELLHNRPGAPPPAAHAALDEAETRRAA